MVRRTFVFALFSACLVLFAGCAEVEEEFSLRSDGTGTYALTLAWDQALRERLVDLVGPRIAARFEGRALPWREADWREGLTGLAGIRVNELGISERSDGWRELKLKLAFDRLEDLLAWELFARRHLRVTQVPRAEADGEGASGTGDEEMAALETDPLADVPVLDPLAAVLGWQKAPPPAGEGGQLPLLDPAPLERLGLSLTQAGLAARMLAPHLDRVRLRVLLRVPRRVASAHSEGADVVRSGREATLRLTFADLARPGSRRLRVQWARRDFDRVPEIDHAGDRPFAIGTTPARSPIADPPR